MALTIPYLITQNILFGLSHHTRITNRRGTRALRTPTVPLLPTGCTWYTDVLSTGETLHHVMTHTRRRARTDSKHAGLWPHLEIVMSYQHHVVCLHNTKRHKILHSKLGHGKAYHIFAVLQEFLQKGGRSVSLSHTPPSFTHVYQHYITISR